MSRITAGRLCLVLAITGLVVLVGGLYSMPACAQAGPTGRLEITSLLHGDNVSELCMRMAADTRTSQLVALQPIDGVLTADVSPGVYDVAVFLMADDGLGEYCIVPLFTVTILAGELLSRTVIFP